jgi:hypothetical protein
MGGEDAQYTQYSSSGVIFLQISKKISRAFSGFFWLILRAQLNAHEGPLVSPAQSGFLSTFGLS